MEEMERFRDGGDDNGRCDVENGGEERDGWMR